MHVSFDIEAFACALDTKRFKDRMTWRDVAIAAGVSPSTACRIIQRKRPDVDSLAKLLTWLKQPFEQFITEEQNQ